MRYMDFTAAAAFALAVCAVAVSSDTAYFLSENDKHYKRKYGVSGI